jgi:glycosyltransferase involved in cell wall biosynthesis
MNFSREGLRRGVERLGYGLLATLKDAGSFPIKKNIPFFGFTRRGRTTAAFMKARKLADLFVTSPLHNGILYVCSGHIPLSYCLREKKRGVRLVVNQNGVYYPGWYGPEYAAANERHLAGSYRAANYLIYQSAFCRDAARRFLGEPACPSEILHNPVDTGFFTPGGERPFDPGAPVFLATGNFSHPGRAGRLTLLLEAFALVRDGLPRSRLLVAGFALPALKAMMAQAGPGVRYLGPYRYEHAPTLYRRGDIYLNTQFNDNCPSAVLEAMACGLPVVHLACGGTPELVGDSGVAVPVEPSWKRFLYPPPQTYAAAMLEAVRRRDQLALSARRRGVEQFDLGIWKKRHHKIFAALR